MTRYEGFDTNGWSTVDRFACTGWLWMDIKIETAPVPGEPGMHDWAVTACQLTDTICQVNWFRCQDGKKAVDLLNYGTKGKKAGEYVGLFNYGYADDSRERPNILKGPLQWPAPSEERLPNGRVIFRSSSEFAKIFFLGCCSDGCYTGPPGLSDKSRHTCHEMAGTVNINDLPDPSEAYYGIGPDSPAYYAIDKVAAHAHMEAMKHFGPGGRTNPPQFAACCRGGGFGSSNSTGGGSNG